MTWIPGSSMVRCDASWYTGRRKPCSSVVYAASQEAARRLAADMGWTRGKRAGMSTDLCGQHTNDGEGLL